MKITRAKKENFLKPNALYEEVIEINRITKVVKGGRRFRFSALVVVGDKKGKIGFATGKAHEVIDAIRKALEKAKKRLITLSFSGNTIPHDIIGNFSASRTILKPTSKGKGIVAGGKAARAVFELAGISDISSKNLGSRTAINVLKSVINGLQKLKTVSDVERIRGIDLASRRIKSRKI